MSLQTATFNKNYNLQSDSYDYDLSSVIFGCKNEYVLFEVNTGNSLLKKTKNYSIK
jgi:hypothetical protein